MNKNLKAKLSKYSALTVAYSASALYASAEQVKDTVNYTGGFETYSIDIDGDGTNDFAVTCVQWATSYVGNSFNMEFYGNNEMVIDSALTSGTNPYPKLLSQSYLLTADKNFGVDSNVWLGGTSYAPKGMFGGGYKKNAGGQVYKWGAVGGRSGFYLGVKFDISGETHYGWMRFNVSTQINSWKLIDMGYEDQPDTSVKVNYEEPPLSLENENTLEANIQKAGEFLVFDVNNSKALSEVELINISGKTVLKENNASKIFIGKMPKGVYFIKLTSTKGILTKKIYI